MATTTNLSLNQPTYGSTVPTWDQPLNANETILDNQLTGTTSIALLNTNVTLTGPNSSGTGQTQAMRILLTGALAANVTVTIPSGISGRWIVYNTTTNAYTVRIASGGGGTSVIVPQGYNTSLYSDGTNIRFNDDGIGAATGFPTLTVFGSAYLATTSGSVGIGTLSPTTILTVNGTVTATSFSGAGTGLTGTAASLSIGGTASNITGTYSGSISSSQVTTGLGYTPYNSTNPAGYITSSGPYTGSLSSSQVTTALGYTPYNSSNPAGYLSGVVSAANGGTGLSSPGTSGNVLTSNGSGWTSQSISSSGQLIRAPQILTSVGTATYTTPSGCNHIYVELVGGGGGAGTPGTDPGYAGSGGGGAYAAKYFTVSPSTGYTYTVGGGGSGAGATGGSTGNGGNGGSTSITVGGVTVTAGGGGGSTGGSAQVGGVGGTATNGDLNVSGGAGSSSNSSFPINAGGASPLFGPPTFHTGSSLTGTNGQGYGSGGSSSGYTSYASGSGAQGMIRIWEFT